MELITVKAVIGDVIYKNDDNGYTVCYVESETDGGFVAVGYMSAISVGESILMTGSWVEHPDYGEQFKLQYYEVLLPSEEENILKYLSSGIVSGIREATAKKIIEKFGDASLDIMLSDPLRLSEIKGISKERAKKIGDAFYKIQSMQNIVMFLQKYNVSANMAVKINKVFGDSAVDAIKKNPYILADKIDGIGFKTADEIALSEGFLINNPDRINSGIKFLLKSAAYSAGHTYLPETILKEAGRNKLCVSNEEIENTLDKLVLERDVIEQVKNGEKVYYLCDFYDAEQYCAMRLASLVKSSFDELLPESSVEEEIRLIEKEENISLAKEQITAVKTVLTNGCMVLTGGPGTGKTTTINTIIKIISKTGLKIALAAPTGRAAKRITQVTGREAKTIHRLLEAVGTSEETRFNRNEENPIDADMVILDEVSMVDILLMNSFLRALRPGTRIVLAGDADQLPSVGAGEVLNDIITCEHMPVIRLEKIFRQAEKSLIVVNAHKINKGVYPVIDTNDNDFFYLKRTGLKSIAETIVDLYKNRLPSAYKIDPVSTIQVLSPGKKSIAGIINLNSMLQNAINPPDVLKAEYAYGNKVFRTGDKVMQIKNNYDMYYSKENGEDGLGIFNGDMGIIENIFVLEKIMVILFDDERRVEYPFSNLDELELSYAITVHKSQGSEFPVVIMPVCAFSPLLMCRNLFYTAVTRAKDMVILVGEEDAIFKMTDNNRENNRYSGLKECIKQKFM